jgi:hypothetical protein
VLAWHLLTKGEPYRWARPSLVARKRRQLELRAGAPRRARGAGGVASEAQRALERAVLERAEAAYVESVRARRERRDAAAATGERLDGPVVPVPAAPRG